MKSDHFNFETIYGFCEKICYFFLMNLLILIANLPVLLFFLFIGISQVRQYLPLFLLCLLPAPLSLSALFFSMNRVIRKTEKGVFRDFKEGYVQDIPRKLKMAAGQLLAILIFWTNTEFFSKQVPVLPLTVFFFSLFVFTILLTPYLYLLLSRYEMKCSSVLKASCLLMYKNPAGTLGNVAVLGLLLMAVELSAGTAMLFFTSIYGFLIVFVNQPMMKKLEAPEE